jgi:hypothetical protein
MVENIRSIHNQFDFRQRHSKIQRTHRIAWRINEALENRQYCSAAFLDIKLSPKYAYWTSVQAKMIAPSQSFPYTKILLA